MQAFRLVQQRPLVLRAAVGLLSRPLSSKQPKKGKKGGGGDDKAAGGAGAAGAVSAGSLPLNYLKDGEDPKVLPTEEYPPWLWQLELPTLNELERKGYANLSLKEERRYWRLKTVRKIKEQNADTSF